MVAAALAGAARTAGAAVLLKRIIVCLDIRDGRTTKGVRFQGNVDVGDPVEMARRYYLEGVDELVFYDIMASSENRGLFLETVRAVARVIFIPFSVGGGIGSVEDMRAALLAGAEKVSVNSQAVKRPQIIEEGARQFGSQCVVLGVDALADSSAPSGYRVYINGGRVRTERDLLEWGREAQERGAGEIVLNSIDADGTEDGYELTATAMLSDALNIPIVASGGAGTVGHIRDVLTRGRADAALIASMVHYGRHTLPEIKTELAGARVPVRVI